MESLKFRRDWDPGNIERFESDTGGHSGFHRDSSVKLLHPKRNLVPVAQGLAK